MILSSVLLPAPLPPVTSVTVPRAKAQSTFLSTRAAP